MSNVGFTGIHTAMPPDTSFRHERERELLAATRRLFDERGMQDAPIEEIAKAVGIARGLIYRQFSSKEELFFLTVTDYLDELCELLEMAAGSSEDPGEQLERLAEAFAGFCQRYPAFLDLSVALMRRPGRDLYEMVSESVWLRLGQGMARCLAQLADVLRRGTERGAFHIDDSDYTATVLWTSVLGTMHLARLGIGVRQLAPGVPGIFTIPPERLVETCVANVRAIVSAS